jgi:hypothetical protein
LALILRSDAGRLRKRSAGDDPAEESLEGFSSDTQNFSR